MRAQMGENYRTLLGHFRHELGHYYWDRLIRDDPEWLERFRSAFGDERPDYAEALGRHYAEGPPPDWQARHISAYAASHPGRIGPRPSRTTSTSPTRWKWCMR